MITKLEIYAVVLLVMSLGVAAMGFYQRHEGRVEGRAEVQVVYDKFKAEVAAAGEKARADALKKDADNAKQIADATTGRDTALRMLNAQIAANAGRRAVPLTPAAAAGSNSQCFEPKALSAAVEQYRGRVLSLVTQGDGAQIDAQALIQAWPK